MIKKNNALKLAFWEENKTLQEIADMTGIPRMYLSQAQNGRYLLTDEQQRLVAQALNRPIKALFPQNG
jgi:transcriptional regulator with XRE-family HTH domain